jgi:hypothetical protein
MRGSMPARPAVLAIFLGWSLLESIRERLGAWPLGAWPPTPRRSDPVPAPEAHADSTHANGATDSTHASGATEAKAPGRDPRLWLN